MNGLDATESFELLLGTAAVLDGLQIAVDELDGLEEAAGRFRLPDLAKAAAAEPLNKPIARNRFSVTLDPHRHRHPRSGLGRTGRILRVARIPNLALTAKFRKSHQRLLSPHCSPWKRC